MATHMLLSDPPLAALLNPSLEGPTETLCGELGDRDAATNLVVLVDCELCLALLNAPELGLARAYDVDDRAMRVMRGWLTVRRCADHDDHHPHAWPKPDADEDSRYWCPGRFEQNTLLPRLD